MITILQIIIITISSYFITRNVIFFIKKEAFYTPLKFFTYFFIWSVIFAFAFFSFFARLISEKVFYSTNLNTVIFIGFVAVFILLFRLLRSVEILEKNITELVRENSFNKKDKF